MEGAAKRWQGRHKGTHEKAGGAQQKVNWWRVVFAAAAVSIQVTVHTSIHSATPPTPSSSQFPFQFEPPHLVTIWFFKPRRRKTRFILPAISFRFQFSVFGFRLLFFFDFPFSCCACCSAIMFTSCKWPNANRKLYMEINYDTNATNERTRHDRISPFSLCVLLCRINYLAAPNGN